MHATLKHIPWCQVNFLATHNIIRIPQIIIYRSELAAMFFHVC